jgi:hypothetical protein
MNNRIRDGNERFGLRLRRYLGIVDPGRLAMALP